MKINNTDTDDDDDNVDDDDSNNNNNNGTPAGRTIEVQKGCSRFCSSYRC
jgi:hypothetical protein